MKRLAATSTILIAALLCGGASAAEPNDMFWLRNTHKSPEQVSAAIKSHVENAKWLYLAEFKLKGGEVTAIKICYPPVGKDIFAAGMHVAAMMPCGHIAVYVENGTTRVSMLHPKFMTALYPDENLGRAVATLTPLFESMLSEVTR